MPCSEGARGPKLLLDARPPGQGSTHGVLGAGPAREEGLLCVEGSLPTAVAEPLRGGPAEEWVRTCSQDVSPGGAGSGLRPRWGG